MVPYYVGYLGVEAYALIGFNAILQMWLSLLDMGLSPTLGREIARTRASEVSAMDSVALFRSLEKVFLVLGGVAFAVIWLLRGWLANEWLQAQQLSIDTIALCLAWMGAMAGFRWLSGLYRAGILGLDEQVWLSAVTSIVYTIRFAGVVPLIVLWPRVEIFFAFQAATALGECLILRSHLSRKLPREGIGSASFSWRILKRHGRLSGSLAFTTAVWVLVTQTDKLILSKLLPLEKYGYFMLAVLVASGISMISAPLQQTFQPRFNYLAAKESRGESEATFYHLATQLTLVAVLPVGIVMALWPGSVVYAWTGDRVIAISASSVLPFYAMGNVFLAILSPVYYLQIARGYLRLHVIGHIFFALVLIPLVYWAALTYGAVGASQAWFGLNLLFLLFWVPLVLRRLIPSESRAWYINSLLIPSAAAVAFALAAKFLLPDDWTRGRWLALADCTIAWIVISAATILAARKVRERTLALFRR